MKPFVLPVHVFLLLMGGIMCWKNAPAQDIGQTFAMGQAALEQNRPKEAILYFRRVLFFAQDDLRQRTYERLATGHELLREPDKALHYLELAFFNEGDDSLRQELSFRQLQQYLMTGQPEQAQRVLDRITRSAMRGQQRNRWTFYQSTLWYLAGDYEKAHKGFQQLVKDDSSRAELAQLFAQANKLRRPNPNTAFWLSIVPGVGQLYAGFPGQALNSATVNGAIFTTAVVLGRTVDLSETVVVMLTLGTRYYQGGMERARRLAIKKRQLKRARHWQQVLRILKENTSNEP